MDGRTDAHNNVWRLLIKIAEDVFCSSSGRLQFGFLHQIFFVQFSHFPSLGAGIPIQAQNEHRVVQNVDAQQRHADLKWSIK